MLNAIDEHSPGSRQPEDLYVRIDDLVLDHIRRAPGIQRRQLWLSILAADFVRFRRSEFNGAVKALRDTGCITGAQ